METSHECIVALEIDGSESIEIKDKDAGWIRTGWKTTTFSEQVVRTQLEVRVSFNNSEAPTYKVRLISEIRGIMDGVNSFVKYNRVLNRFTSLIDELQTSIAKGQ